MLRRPALLLLVPLLLLPGCSGVRDTAGRAVDCVNLAADVAPAGLSGTPTLQDAEAAARRLDARIPDLRDDALRARAGELRDRLDELTTAARAADTAAVDEAATRARDAARATADLCGVPVDQLLG